MLRMLAVFSRFGKGSVLLGRFSSSSAAASPTFVMPMTGGSPFFTNSYKPVHLCQQSRARLSMREIPQGFTEALYGSTHPATYSRPT